MRSGYKGILPWVAILAMGAPWVAAEEFTATVVRVIDGNTLDVQREEDETVQIRLFGVDCPNIDQSFGARAQQFTSSLVFQKEVTVVIVEAGPDGALQAKVLRASGSQLAELLLRAGLAWCTTASKDDDALLALQKEAQAKRRGLWSDPQAAVALKLAPPVSIVDDSPVVQDEDEDGETIIIKGSKPQSHYYYPTYAAPGGKSGADDQSRRRTLPHGKAKAVDEREGYRKPPPGATSPYKRETPKYYRPPGYRTDPRYDVQRRNLPYRYGPRYNYPYSYSYP